MGGQPGLSNGGVLAEVAAAAREESRRPGYPHAYLDRVRAAAGWLGVSDGAADDVRFAALVLDRQAQVDLEPPMAARDLPRRLFKQVVRKLIGWYVRFLGQQVSALGQAAARLGLAVAERTERLGAEAAGLSAEVAALRARVERLEAAADHPHDGAP